MEISFFYPCKIYFSSSDRILIDKGFLSKKRVRESGLKSDYKIIIELFELGQSDLDQDMLILLGFTCLMDHQTVFLPADLDWSIFLLLILNRSIFKTPVTSYASIAVSFSFSSDLDMGYCPTGS